MEKILMFVTDHYYIFLIATVVLIISVVGYFIDDKKKMLNQAMEVPMDEEEIKNNAKK